MHPDGLQCLFVALDFEVTCGLSKPEERLASRVTDATVTAQALLEHPEQHRNVAINVVDDLDFVLCWMQAMEPTCVLCQRALPRYRESQEERIKPSIIKPLTNVAACCDNNSFLAARDRSELTRCLASHRGTHPTLKYDNMSCKFRQLSREILEMVFALSEQNWRTTLFERANHVIENKPVAPGVGRERCV